MGVEEGVGGGVGTAWAGYAGTRVSASVGKGIGAGEDAMGCVALDVLSATPDFPGPAVAPLHGGNNRSPLTFSIGRCTCTSQSRPHSNPPPTTTPPIPRRSGLPPSPFPSTFPPPATRRQRVVPALTGRRAITTPKTASPQPPHSSPPNTPPSPASSAPRKHSHFNASGRRHDANLFILGASSLEFSSPRPLPPLD